MIWDKPVNTRVVEPPRAISDQVYEFLKQKILYSDIEAGERLMQIQVAEALQTSRTPVRDAFRRLEQDGLVERVPQGGVRVTSLDNKTIREVFGIRQVLEAYAVELACDNISPEQIAYLNQILSQARELLASRKDREAKLKELFKLNSQLHDTIYRASGSSYLMGIINNLKNIVLRMRSLGLRADKTWNYVWKEHAQLIDCLERRDKAAAADLIKAHIISAASHVTSVTSGAV